MALDPEVTRSFIHYALDLLILLLVKRRPSTKTIQKKGLNL